MKGVVTSLIALNELNESEPHLINIKSDERIEIEWITIKLPNQEKHKFGNTESKNDLLSCLKNINVTKEIELQVSPTKYPSSENKCGNVIHHFPPVKILMY